MSIEWVIDDDFLDEETKLSADGQGYLTELVRCKDCKYRQEHVGMGDHRWCDIVNGSRCSDDFCSYGKRKDDER